jgi:hypothetical protein
LVARKKPEQRTGAAAGFADDPRFVAIAKGTSRRHRIPIPDVNPNWHSSAQSWFRALKLSGQCEFYEASDWATAVFCAQIYDTFMRTQKASLLPAFMRLSERLGVTVIDRKRNRIELDEPELTDEDEDAANEAVVQWHGRLGIVRDVDGPL